MITLVYYRIGHEKLLKRLAIVIALSAWLTWFTVMPVYTVGYGADREVIKAYAETKPAHSFGMETKERIFYSGLFLATLLPIITYTVDLKSNAARRFLLWILILLIIGTAVVDGLGGWISVAARQAWSFKAGG